MSCHDILLEFVDLVRETHPIELRRVALEEEFSKLQSELVDASVAAQQAYKDGENRGCW
jgi:hypothetical protein